MRPALDPATATPPSFLDHDEDEPQASAAAAASLRRARRPRSTSCGSCALLLQPSRISKRASPPPPSPCGPSTQVTMIASGSGGSLHRMLEQRRDGQPSRRRDVRASGKRSLELAVPETMSTERCPRPPAKSRSYSPGSSSAWPSGAGRRRSLIRRRQRGAGLRGEGALVELAEREPRAQDRARGRNWRAHPAQRHLLAQRQ